MNKLTSTFLTVLLLSSCAQIFSGNKERKLQTEILARINENAPSFGQCAKKSAVFDKLDKKRIRVVLFLNIKPNGSVEKFKLDGNNYPEDFTNCFFQTVELIQFPKFDSHELIKIEQPFVFNKK